MGMPRVISPWITTLVGCAALWMSDPAGAVPDSIKVGNLTLTLCNTDYTGYCGTLVRPIDPNDVSVGKITIGFGITRERTSPMRASAPYCRRRAGPGIHRPAREIST